MTMTWLEPLNWTPDPPPSDELRGPQFFGVWLDESSYIVYWRVAVRYGGFGQNKTYDPVALWSQSFTVTGGVVALSGSPIKVVDTADTAQFPNDEYDEPTGFGSVPWTELIGIERSPSGHVLLKFDNELGVT